MELKKKNHGLFVGVIYFRQRYSLHCLFYFLFIYFKFIHFIFHFFIGVFGIIPCPSSIRLLSSLHFILLKVFFHIFSLPILFQFPFTCYRIRWSVYLSYFFSSFLLRVESHSLSPHSLSNISFSISIIFVLFNNPYGIAGAHQLNVCYSFVRHWPTDLFAFTKCLAQFWIQFQQNNWTMNEQINKFSKALDAKWNSLLFLYLNELLQPSNIPSHSTFLSILL